MIDPPQFSSPPSDRRRYLVAAIALIIAAVVASSVYANFSFLVTDPAGYRWFPPFEAGVNANENDHLGAATEYANVARALVDGKGFADPFGRPSGPTAWMPPVLPAFLAGLLWFSNGSAAFMLWSVVFAQVLVLAGTGVLILALVRQSTSTIAPMVAAAVFVAALLCQFRLSFQWTHDCWLNLLTLDSLIAGACWYRTLRVWQTACGWGVFGGFCTLVNPIVGLAWAVLSVVIAIQERAWRRLCITVLVGFVTLIPWTAWNYWQFGRLIPVKSNLAYELYQSQCLQPDGLIRRPTFAQYPGVANNAEARAYDALGEIAYLDRKAEQFHRAMWAAPTDFLNRAAARFLGATLWYVPFDPIQEARRPWTLWWSRLTHPLPFLALMALVVIGIGDRLNRTQWIVMGVYLLYLMPYVVISYYERYAFPLVGLKVLLVVFAADRLWSFVAVRIRTRTGDHDYEREAR
jgi:hypothetical protein